MTIRWFTKHVHEWEETGRVHVSPSLVEIDARGRQVIKFLSSMMEHRTSIHLRCRQCGDVCHRVLLGWSPGVKKLGDLLSKD